MKHVLVFVLLSLVGQAPPIRDWQDDFPPQDSGIARQLARAHARIDAAERVRTAPADVETVRALADLGDYANLLESLRLIVDEHPERMAPAFEAVQEALHELRGDAEQAIRNRDALLQLVAAGRQRLDTLAKEDAARADFAFLTIDTRLSREPDTRVPRLYRFVDRYQGTEAALLAEVELVTPYGRSSEAIDAFIARHPGTTAAAKAIYTKGFEYRSIGVREARNGDPLPRFERLEAVVRELESGRYPESEWTRRAPELIGEFYISDDARIPPASLERLIAAFEAFARRRFVPSTLLDLYARRGDPAAQFERLLSTLERSPGASTAVGLMRASYHLQERNRETPEQRTSRIAKAKAALRTVSEAGDSAPHRRALATLAALEFEEDGCKAAIPTLREYLARYPRTSWSWVAHARIGHCQDVSGDTHAAVAAYRRVAAAGAGVPVARALGHASAGRLLETTDDLEAALGEYRQALVAWEDGFEDTYSAYFRRPWNPDESFGFRNRDASISKSWLIQRISTLTELLSTPGGALLLQARALLARGDLERAEAIAGRVLTKHPESPLTDDARYVLHVARLERALALANAHRPGHDRGRAARILDELVTEPLDFAVIAARIARATLRWDDGVDPDAQERELKAALADWLARQPLREPVPGVEEDVADIREAVFRPHGGGVYDEYWRNFPWPDASTPYFIVNTELAVGFVEGESRTFTIAHPLPQAGRILFLDSAQLDLLARVPDTLMRRVFPARAGDWTRWQLEAYPVITQIVFTNPERTKASVQVMIADTTGTVELEKRAGRWVALRVVDFGIA